jgi:hypothetical protein
LTGEDEGGGDEKIGILTTYRSPSPLSPPASGGEEEFPGGNYLVEQSMF